MNGTLTATESWTEAEGTEATWTYPYSYPYRIRLTLSEVNKLRAAAKKDKAVKEILKKFTNHIDLVVDFE